MERIYDTYSTSDAANEAVGYLDDIGWDAYVREIDSNTFVVIVHGNI